MTPIESLVTPGPVSVGRSATLDVAARLMKERHVGALVVLDGEGRLAGIVTDRDLVVKGLAQGREAISCTVSEVMTPGVVTAPGSLDVQEALELMRSRGVRRLVVTKASGGMAGMLSLDDVVDSLKPELGGILRSGYARELARG